MRQLYVVIIFILPLNCIIEPVHSHVSDTKLTQRGSAKIWLSDDGRAIVQDRGKISDSDLRKICRYIELNFDDMVGKWENFTGEKSNRIRR